MRILLTANASYAPPRGGATRSNLLWLDRLARAGHECRVICGPPDEGAEFTPHPSVTIDPVADPGRRIHLLRVEIQRWRPDWVLVSSEDLSHTLLREAHHSAPGRVVYLAHTPQFFPFGPESWNPDQHASEIIAGCAGIVVIGSAMAEYVERSLGRAASVIHPPIYGDGPFPEYRNFNRGRVVMINPCAVKGAGIFIEAATRLSSWEFGVAPGWATTAEDRAALAQLPNIRFIPNARHIDEILAQTRILMMPSLWFEGFGLIVMEAMLRGIPVVASDSGGLKDAKSGTGYVIPVRTIERYQPVFDEHAMPKPVAPDNDVTPWVAALAELLTDRDAYERESRRSREAALRFVQAINPDAIVGYLASLRPRLDRMRILLAQNSLYYPAHGGGDKSNRLLLEALSARGHDCRVVARPGSFGDSYGAELAARGVAAAAADGVLTFERAGVDVHVVVSANLRAHFAAQIETFQPDVILVSTDDPGQLLLDPALRSQARVVYLARATLALPFGPDCAFLSESRTARIRDADAVVGVSGYVANYLRRYAGIDAVHVPISLMEPEEWPRLGRFENEFVTMVNPCAVKGIAIFLALADAFPELTFAAVPSWGTDERDRAALEARSNIKLLNPVDDINILFRRTRVLLVPSVWAEARSRIVVEAMLRGVPVIAADTGGLPEAKMGVPYLLPVNPIASYQPRLDEKMVPVPIVPPQNIEPWREALSRLTGDRAHYEEVACASRKAALRYAETLTVAPFEALLNETLERPKKLAQTPVVAAKHFSPEKRRLFAIRLRQRAPAAAWFPGADSTRKPCCFWFPHAGGGAAQALPLPGVFPVRLPGRESRLAEAPFEKMTPLVQALATAIEPYLSRDYAFFGHSMGAVIAFELARELRRRNLALPRVLIASAARAPQFRRNHVAPPQPADEELLRQAELPDDAAVRHAILPALRADTALYRAYVYSEDAPLPCSIHAYGGIEDPHIAREHLDSWGEQTSASFSVRLFPGGHFYLRTAEREFESALRQDLGL